MIVVRRIQGGQYILTKMDGAISRLRYSAFHLLPYLPPMLDNISPTAIVAAELKALTYGPKTFPLLMTPWTFPVTLEPMINCSIHFFSREFPFQK